MRLIDFQLRPYAAHSKFRPRPRYFLPKHSGKRPRVRAGRAHQKNPGSSLPRLSFFVDGTKRNIELRQNRLAQTLVPDVTHQADDFIPQPQALIHVEIKRLSHWIDAVEVSLRKSLVDQRRTWMRIARPEVSAIDQLNLHGLQPAR